MNTKVVAISTLAIGATALGGMLLMRSAPEETDTAPDRLASNTAKVQDSYFDSGLSGSDAERPERAEISTQNRSSNSTPNGRGGFGAMLDRATEFDADGDGILSDEERATMMRAMRDEWMARMDLDGDGELSREERRTQREEQRQNWGDRMGEATIEFDRDGDGVLSIEESQEAYAVYQQRREIDQFVSQYDSDGNGSMGNADYSAFLSAYEQGNAHADVNRDGIVNSQDLAAYTDMVTRSRNRP
jgi:Ca2+-binding EF-hand superfamily protein